MTTKFFTILLTLVGATFAVAGPEPLIIDDKNPCDSCKWDDHRVDSHAPIGVMGDHTHGKGEWMLSYRYMFMDMRPNYIGSNQVSPAQARGAGFAVAPTNMQTQMHMAGIMYGLTDNLTLAAMFSQVDKSMDHAVANGATFRTSTNGMGDFKFGGLLKIFDDACQRVHLNLMMSAPTGDFKETGLTPLGVRRLPYPMQLGSGTWDLLPGITYLGQKCDFSWGGQLLGTVRLGENSEDYALGNEFTANGWVAYRLSDCVSTSFRATYKNWGDVDGRDALINLPVATARPDLRAGESLDLFGGVNYMFPCGIFKGHRIAAEAGTSVWQDLDGPQLGMDWMVTLGWQKAF
ncbi:MAG: hypothetical protein P1V20_19020 [Verrucomicrobiales bacterium]|nr:hypothetical protein [Verrucomicrobiales bacterium]